jgi:Flp pilus assembly pilin Flp
MRRVILARKEDLKMKTLIARLTREDAGQDLVEYGLLLGLISAATVAIISELGQAVVGQFSKMKALID